MARAKKTSARSNRSSTKRVAPRVAARKSKPLKKNSLFSALNLIIVMIVVAVAVVALSIKQHSDVSNAIAVGGPLGNPGPGYVGNLSAKSSNTNLTATVSGSSITLTGSNLAPGDTIRVGRSSAKASLVSVNSDGTTTVTAPVNTGGCAVQAIPLLRNLCNNVTSGQNKLTITTSGGNKSTTASIGLTKTLGAPQAATIALGSALSGKTSSCPSGTGPTATGGCAKCGPDNCAAGCNSSGYGMKFIKPTSSDIWNYGTPFTITWQNCTNGLLNLSAQPGGSPSTGGNSVFLPPQFFISFNLFDTAGEDAGPGGAVPVPGGGYKAGTGGYTHLCGILSSDSKFSQGLAVFSIPGLNDPGKTNSLTLSKCKTDIGSHAASVQHIPTGHYKVSFAIDVATGVKGCSPGYRCSGLPDRIGGPTGSQSKFQSERFQLNNQ